MEDPLLDDWQAAELLSIKAQTLRKWRFRKFGPAYVRMGGKLIRYRLSTLTSWIESRQVSA